MVHCRGPITSGWHNLGLESSFFGRFLLRLNRIKCPKVLSMLKFCQTAPDLGYNFWAQNSVSSSPCIQVIHFLKKIMYLAFEGCDSRWFKSKMWKSECITFHILYCFPWKCEARFCVKFSSVCGDKFHYWEELSHRFNKIAHLLCPGNLQCALIILKIYPTRWDSQMHIQFIQQLAIINFGKHLKKGRDVYSVALLAETLS